jgi:Domain of unknown function (DUF5668)
VNRYILIHRLRAPAVLLLIGVLALLHQMGVIDHFWHLFWPLLFILIGAILLAERAFLSMDSGLISGDGDPSYPGAPYPGAPYPGAPYQQGAPYPGAPYPGAPYAGAAPVPPAPASTAIVPAHSHDFDDDDTNGGQR